MSWLSQKEKTVVKSGKRIRPTQFIRKYTISPLTPLQSSCLIYHYSSLLVSVHLFVQLFRVSVSEELNKTAVKPAHREWRWQVKSFFFSPFLLSGFKTHILGSFLSFVMLFCPNKGRSKLSSLAGWGAVGWCYYPGVGPWRDHRPLLHSQWHLHSLSLCNNMSQAALSFTINLCGSYF